MLQALPLVAQPDLRSQVEAVERDGYVYLPGVLDGDQVAELRGHMERLEPLAESYDRAYNHEHGFINRAINNAFNRDPHFVQFLDYPGVIEIAEALLGANCHVIAMTSWLTGPGRPDQMLHADYQALTLPEDVMADPRVRIPVYIATAHYYLDDLTEEIGPTRFIPGSHRAGRAPDGDTSWQGREEQSILCNAGEVVILRSRRPCRSPMTPRSHGASASVSAAVTRSVSITMVPPCSVGASARANRPSAVTTRPRMRCASAK